MRFYTFLVKEIWWRNDEIRFVICFFFSWQKKRRKRSVEEVEVEDVEVEREKITRRGEYVYLYGTNITEFTKQKTIFYTKNRLYT